MQLLDHVSITVRDLNLARQFYDAIFKVLGVRKVYDREDAIGYGTRNRKDDDAHSYLSIYLSSAASADPRRHWCFRAQSAAQVRAFHSAGIAAGGIDAGAPGLRTDYHAAYFAAFLADPEDNRIEAVWHRGQDG
ncbi:MAG TPA: VOC family protein [Burkholderiales bacterium]|jgi:catechol 2,3-dioxygenase-like lactoylglutathione lyase family enzyme|nr:VOC family protein [Burkholderiales bacterium]